MPSVTYRRSALSTAAVVASPVHMVGWSQRASLNGFDHLEVASGSPPRIAVPTGGHTPPTDPPLPPPTPPPRPPPPTDPPLPLPAAPEPPPPSGLAVPPPPQPLTQN